MNECLLLFLNRCGEEFVFFPSSKMLHWTEVMGEEEKPPPRADALSKVVGEKLWIAGGRCGSKKRSDIWGFDLTVGVWNQIKLKGSSQPSEICQESAAIFERAMYVWGGHGESLIHNTVWVMDCRSPRWEPQKSNNAVSLSPSYSTETATSLDPLSGPIVFGGRDGCCSNKVQQLDVRNLSWSLGACRGSGPSKRHSHATALDSTEQQLYVTCGHDGNNCNDIYKLSLSNLMWEPITALGIPLKRSVSASCVFYDYRLSIFGGFSYGSYHNTVTVLDVTDPTTISVPASSNSPSGRSGSAFTSALHTSKGSHAVLCFGGYDGSRYLNDLHMLSESD